MSGGETIGIEGNNNYTINIDEGHLEGQKAKAEITVLPSTFTLKIKCEEYHTSDQKFQIKLFGASSIPQYIGGFTMMENTPLILTFRVIALVLNEGNPSEKARKLFEQYKDADITKYLNENSLNQAGYEVVIDNQDMFDNIDTLPDFTNYLYVFDKTKWIAENKYTEDYPKKKKWEKVKKADGIYEVGADGYYKQIEVEYTESTNVLYNETIDDDVIEAYTSNMTDKSYNKGFIILSDYK